MITVWQWDGFFLGFGAAMATLAAVWVGLYLLGKLRARRRRKRFRQDEWWLPRSRDL